MSTPTEADLDAMLERADAATPGPWLLDRPPDKDGWATGMIVAATYRGQNVYSTHGSVVPEANRRFIAHARTDVPKLVTALREARATIARVEACEAKAIAHDKFAATFALGEREAAIHRLAARGIRAALAPNAPQAQKET